MTFQFYGDGLYGEVFVEDQRPDGSVVMLICREGAQRDPNVQTRSRDRGSRAQTGLDFEEFGLVAASSKDGGAFPLLNETGRASRRLPKVHVDTTEMPGGVLRFAQRIFGRKAMEVAASGVREVHLTPTNAQEWGWENDLADVGATADAEDDLEDAAEDLDDDLVAEHSPPDPYGEERPRRRATRQSTRA